MAERRMFSKKIIESDNFMDLSLSSQALYFHLCISADDDGFVNSVKSIIRTSGADTKDLSELKDANFIIQFPSGIVCITHWKVHNYLRKDRYKPSDFIEEKKQLYINNQMIYSLDSAFGIPLVAIGKDRLEIGKDSIGKNNISDSTGKKKNKSAFNNINQNVYDFDALERAAIKK